MAVKFERKDARVTVAFLDCVREGPGGRSFKSLTAVRAIKERDGWRVDRADAVAGTWTPWEPLVGMTMPRLSVAKAVIRNFARVCKLPPGNAARKQYGLFGARKRRGKKRR